MKNTPVNEYHPPLEITTAPEPAPSKQEQDMFRMKAITLLAKENIKRKNIQEMPIHLIEQSKENIRYLQMTIPLPDKIITLKGQFQRLSNKDSFPIKDSFAAIETFLKKT